MIHIVTSSNPAFAEANAQPFVAYRNLLAEGTVTDAALPAAAPRANAVTESTFDFWESDNDPDTLRVSLASAQEAAVAMIAAHSLGSQGATLEVQYYDGADWQTIHSVTPTDDQPFCIIWDAISADGWGLRITGALAQIGMAWIGPRLVIPGGVLPDYSPVWAGRRVTKYPGTSRRGQWFGQRIERVGGSVAPEFMPIPYTFAESNMAEFRDHYNEGRAFVWASAPSVFPDDVAYCWAPDEAVFAPTVLAGGELVNLALTMEAYVEP